MKSDPLHAQVEHETAELKGAFPHVAAVHHALEEAKGAFSMRLDIRWSQHQTLIAGPLREDAQQAVRAAFRLAHEHLRRTT